jgi:hypothetical protein
MPDYKTISKSYTKQQLAEFLFEDRFANHTMHIKQTTYDLLVNDFVKSCTNNLTKAELLAILKDIEYPLVPEPQYDK